MNRLHHYILILGICLTPFLSPAQNTFIPLGGPTGADIYAMEVCANGTIYLSTGRSIYRSNDNGDSSHC